MKSAACRDTRAAIRPREAGCASGSQASARNVARRVGSAPGLREYSRSTSRHRSGVIYGSSSSRSSQTFARPQSRITVMGDTFSTSAVSSTLRPPKNRNSTILALPLVERRQGFQRLIERDDVRARFARNGQRLVQRDLNNVATALLLVPRARHVDQDAPHQLRREREKMRAILPADAAGVDEPEIGFVDQRGRLQGMAGAFARHVRWASRCSSSCTSGISRSSACSSPAFQASNSWVISCGASLCAFRVAQPSGIGGILTQKSSGRCEFRTINDALALTAACSRTATPTSAESREPRLSLTLCALVLTSLTSAAFRLARVEAASCPGKARDCRGEPCDAVFRGARAFFDRRLHGLERKRAAPAPTATW